ncbi:MAG: J domain-containing protein [Armatimonadetes bacterium]|nr:J domain-containing protein [Armatimonadota bacterium]
MATAVKFKDYYKILGVDRKADQKTISQAYRRLARKHHPDVNPGSKQAEEKFKEINEAHEVVSDPQKRARYDQMYEYYQRGGRDWQEIFPGGRAPAGQPGAQGWTVTYGDAGDLQDLLGRGGFSDFFRTFFGGLDPQGEGVREARTRARPEAAPAEGPRRTGPGGIFERHGHDVHCEIPVTLAEAALGGEIEVPTLTGKATMHIPPETQNGQVFRLRGAGMQKPDGGRGAQMVRVKVVLPQKLSPREKQLFEELRKLRSENPRSDLGCR